MHGPASANSHTILQLTDTHLHASKDSRMRGVRTYDTFCEVIEVAMTHPEFSPDIIVVTGDIVQDESTAGYERFRAALETFALPVLCIPGNHDDPVIMAELLSKQPFQLGGEWRLPRWSLVLLSTFLVGEDAGGLGPQRLAGLDRSLRDHADQNVLIFMHHHAIPMGSRWLDGVALRDANEFLQLVDRHRNVRGIVYGHVHQESDRERNGVRHLSSPSTCAQFLPGSEYFALDNRPPGCRWFRLYDDGSFDSEVQWATPTQEPR
jgi:Icc protein